jgi:hypothetical protein
MNCKCVLQSVILASAFCSSVALATPISIPDPGFETVAATTPTRCANGTLQQYIDLGRNGCLIDDKVFSGFSYFAGNPTPNANQILLTPITTAFDPGFAFTANPGWRNIPSSAIGFNVTVQPNGNPFADASLALLVFAGSTLVTERICLDFDFNFNFLPQLHSRELTVVSQPRIYR